MDAAGEVTKAEAQPPGMPAPGQQGLEGAERLGDREQPSEHKAASCHDCHDCHGKCLGQRGL